MFKTLTSFFRFYYHVIRRSPKQYDIAMEPMESTIAGCTPLFGFLGFVFISIVFGANTAMFFPLFMPIILGNMYFVYKTSDKGYKIRREEYSKREKHERIVREQRARERAEQEYESMLRDRLRQMREEERRQERQRRQQKQEEEMFEEYFKRHYRQQHQKQQQQQQKQQQQSKSNNMSNAMKLLGLSEGYTVKDIKTSYRTLAKKHHPDLGGLEANFIRLTKAYDYLMDRI